MWPGLCHALQVRMSLHAMVELAKSNLTVEITCLRGMVCNLLEPLPLPGASQQDVCLLGVPATRESVCRGCNMYVAHRERLVFQDYHSIKFLS